MLSLLLSQRIRRGLLLMALALLWLPARAAVGDDRAAFAAEPVRYPAATLADPGGRVLLYFEVKNTGANTWPPGTATLNNVRNGMGAAPQYGLSRSVLPNETAYWDFEVAASRTPGVTESVWEIRQGGKAISARMSCYVVVVPPEAKELRAKVQKLIDDFNAQHGQDVKQLIRQISELIAKEGGGLIGRLVSSRCGLLPGMLAVVGVAAGLRRRGLP